MSVAQEYLQKAGAAWKEDYDLLNQKYVIPEGVYLKDVISFVCRSSLGQERIRLCSFCDEHVAGIEAGAREEPNSGGTGVGKELDPDTQIWEAKLSGHWY